MMKTPEEVLDLNHEVCERDREIERLKRELERLKRELEARRAPRCGVLKRSPGRSAERK